MAALVTLSTELEWATRASRAASIASIRADGAVFVGYACKPCGVASAPYIAKQHGPIKHLRSGNAQKTRCKSRVTACAEDICTGREIGIKGLSPWADDRRNPIYEQNIHAAVGQDPLRESGRQMYRLGPETEQIFREGRGRSEFTVIGNCEGHILIAIHGQLSIRLR